MKRYVRKGIPLEHRAHVWLAVSGAQARLEQNPGYYQRLLQGEGRPELEEAIRTGGHAADQACEGRQPQGPGGSKSGCVPVIPALWLRQEDGKCESSLDSLAISCLKKRENPVKSWGFGSGQRSCVPLPSASQKQSTPTDLS